MNTEEFNRDFEIDRTAKPREPIRKNAPPEMTIALTADQKPWSHGPVYFFFDGEKVRDTEHLRRIDAENLGSMGMRIVAISKLRISRDDAIADGQKTILDQIETYREKIRYLESEKTPKNRSLKAYLMARN